MPTYAVKIGEIHLKSDKPITEDERKRAILLLGMLDRTLDAGNGATIHDEPNAETVQFARR